MSARAAVIVTGTEVLTGRVADRNGPWLAEQLRQQGVDIAQVIVVGDRPADLRSALTFLSNVDLIITSGGLGPTADDLTAAVVAEHQGRPLRLDQDLERRIGEIVQRLGAGRNWSRDPVATAAGTRKQAMVPDGASVLSPAGTAPGLIVPPAAGRSGPPVVVLPGPPRELQAMWPAVLNDPAVVQAMSGAVEIRQRTMRLWGTPESELAAVMREHDAALTGLEITTCLSDGELEIVTRYAPDQQGDYDAFRDIVRNVFVATAFSIDGATVDDLVAERLVAQKRTIATAESCTGGLLAARLTERPGSSRYVLGSVVAYANQAKYELLEVDKAVLERFGAVSAEVVEAMAFGACARFGAAIGVGITGVAGPGGGTPDKPVGLVHVCVTDGTVTMQRKVNLPGNRADIRRRTVQLALHLVLQTLDG